MLNIPNTFQKSDTATIPKLLNFNVPVLSPAPTLKLNGLVNSQETDEAPVSVKAAVFRAEKDSVLDSNLLNIHVLVVPSEKLNEALGNVCTVTVLDNESAKLN